MWTSHLYSLLVSNVTDACYRNCLEYVPRESTILDIGIGNGAMIKRHHSTIKSKQLTIIGVDINSRYLAHCELLIQNFGLQRHIRVFNQPVEDFQPPQDTSFDFILFSMSFMLLADTRSVLHRVIPWLTPSGELIFVQTMFHKKSHLLDFIKPKLKYLTTIDFGRVTYEADFCDLLAEMGLTVIEDRAIERKVFTGEYRMITTRASDMVRRHLPSSQSAATCARSGSPMGPIRLQDQPRVGIR